MKHLILIFSLIFLLSCKSKSYIVKENDVQSNETLASTNYFPPADSEVSKILHSNGWIEAYEFYKNDIDSYKTQSYYKVSKVQIIGKILNHRDFLATENSEAYNLFINDIFDDELPSPSLLMNIVSLVESNQKMSSEINLKQILSQNKEYLLKMKESLKRVRNTEYQPDSRISSDLRTPDFENIMSKYVSLN